MRKQLAGKNVTVFLTQLPINDKLYSESDCKNLILPCLKNLHNLPDTYLQMKDKVSLNTIKGMSGHTMQISSLLH